MPDTRKNSAPKLQRVAFTTSRLAEFCGEKELTAQTGHTPDEWPLVIAKELIDNALDACEEAEIAPEISIEVSAARGEIVIADNGPGLPSATLGGVLDYTVRISSREAYVSPSRGQQGNALKCIIAMPFALDGTRGTTVIESQGQAHRILFEMDPVRREPKVLRDIASSDVQNGTRITVRWPETACHLLEDAKRRFVQMVSDFTTFNPHLTIRGCWNNEKFLDFPPTDPGWRKWRTCDPTSAHWYGVEQFERYLAAHLGRDEDHGRTGRRVRDFISELRGLARSGKQKLVLAETETSGVALATFFAGGRSAITSLLNSCQGHTKPVKPEDLGLIGADHLLKDCCAVGAAPESFKYCKQLGTTHQGLPYAIETAFAYCPEGSDKRRLITGVNFSVGIGSPFERLGPLYGLASVAARQHVNHDDPVVLVLHYTCPRVDFADRGKGTLALPREVADEIIGLVETVAKDWTKQRRAELRSAAAEANRRERLLKEQRRPEKKGPPQPTGVLAHIICRAADEQGVSIDAFAVLSPANDPYTAWRRRREAEWFARLFDRFVAAGAAKHLRGFFYLLVSSPDRITAPDGKPFINDYKHWQALQSASKAARWLGLVPFERIIDERNAPPEIYVPGMTPISTSVDPGTGCEMPPTAEAALPCLRLEGFGGRQTHRIIFYGEKSSLSVVLRPIAEKIGAEMILVTGESSDSHIAGMARRASEDGRPAVVFYFSDFDPSGHQMPISVARKLQALRDLYYPDLSIKLYPVALTLGQIHQLGLPSSPLKETERRARRWRDTHGHDQTEIDAMVELHPDALRQAVFDAILPFYDAGLDDRVLAAETKWREEANEALKTHPGYKGVSQRINVAWESASAAGNILHSEQRQAAEILGDSIPSPPELPEAAPEGEAKSALFDTKTDFVTATRQLIRHKKLIALDDNDH
jgi:DNA topoisomerase VI subunit B